jgi:hypothetical protein
LSSLLCIIISTAIAKPKAKIKNNSLFTLNKLLA